MSAYEYTSPLRYASKHQYADEEEAAAAIDAAVEGVEGEATDDTTVAEVDAEANANAAAEDMLETKYMQLKQNGFNYRIV